MQQQESHSRTRASITAAGAQTAVTAALAEATSMGLAITVVVVDESGVEKATLRMDGAPLVSVETARNKAYAAAAIGVATDAFYAAISGDGAAVASFAGRPGLALIAGGLPVAVGDDIAGGIGVAGAMTGAEDRQIAERALAAL